MKRLLIVILCWFVVIRVNAQTVETVISVPYTASSTTPALLYEPPGYPASGVKYPLFMFFHGSGEAGTNLAQIYNSSTAGGMPYYIEHGGWPSDGGFINPKDGQKYKPIVCSPQRNNGWSSSGDEIDFEVQYMVSHYPIDTSRIYLFGLSSGAGGCTEYACHLDGNEDPPTGANNHVRRWKAAAIVPMSSATNRPVASWVVPLAADSTQAWYLGDPINDTYGEFSQDIFNFRNAVNTGYTRGTFNPPYTQGHGGWMIRFIPTYTENVNGVNMNIYQWSLQFTQGQPATAPTANAGTNQTITLPTSSVTLSGSGTAGSGHTISSYGWTKTAGPNTPTIVSPSSASTSVTGLIQGTYTFLLTVTQNDAQTATSTVTITVNSATPVCILGPNQTITLPTNSVTLDGSTSTGTITSYAWTRISGPNTPTIATPTTATTNITGLIQGTYIFQLSLNSGASTARDTVTVLPVPPTYNSPYVYANAAQSVTVNHANLTSNYTLTGATLAAINWTKFKVPGGVKYKVFVLGSSYPTGAGASIDDSGYVGGFDTTGTLHHGHFYDTYHAQGLTDSVYNWAVSGYNVYQVMPTGYVPPSDVTAKLSPSDTTHVRFNITAVLARNPNVVILSFPTNGYDVLTISEVMTPYQIIYDSCKAHGVQCYITTTAPRTDAAYNTTQKRLNLQIVNDSLVNRFGAHCIPFYYGLTITGTFNPIYPSSAGDSIHMNDAGHRVMWEACQAANVFQNLISSTSTITTPNTQNTAIATMPNGLNIFQVSVNDSHGQYYNALDSVTVNVSGAPTANAGTNQTVTLPTTSTTLDGTGSTGAITSYSWTTLSGPNVPTLATPTTATTTVSALKAGTYVFQLSLNGGASVSTVSINVVPQPGCSGRSYIAVPFSDGSLFNDANDGGALYHPLPGDTLRLTDSSTTTGYLTSVDFENIHGTQSCPIVIINDSVSLHSNRGVRFRGPNAQLKVVNSTYIHITGTGNKSITYGFDHNYDTASYQQKWNYATAGGASFMYAINGRSKNIEMDHLYTRHASVGFDIKEDGGCLDSLNKTGSPNDWVMDSIYIHDNYVSSSWNEGMYIGNTSPDNGPNSYDVRPVICSPGDTTYPRPIRMGNLRVIHNIVDSTGRGGIQAVSGSGPLFEISFNHVTHSGRNGDEGQGANITTGTYAYVYIHDNYCSNPFTWNISSQGAGYTNHTNRVQNNILDSAGYCGWYYGAATHVDGADSMAEPFLFREQSNILTYPHQIYWATRQVDSLPQQDSVLINISGNKCGIFKNNLGDFIQVQENSNIGTPGYNHFQINGNFICSNTKLDGVTPVLGVQNSDAGAAVVNYSTNCAGASAPTVNQLTNAVITLPSTSIAVVGVATPASGLTISSYIWTQVSGPNVYTIQTPTASSTVISGLTIPYGQVRAIYSFRLSAVQSDGQIGSATIQITYQLANFVKPLSFRRVFKNAP